MGGVSAAVHAALNGPYTLKKSQNFESKFWRNTFLTSKTLHTVKNTLHTVKNTLHTVKFCIKILTSKFWLKILTVFWTCIGRLKELNQRNETWLKQRDEIVHS